MRIRILSFLLTVLIAFPVSATFSESYEMKKLPQFVHSVKAGTQIQLRNKTNKYALCAIAINNGVGAATLFIGPKQTVAFDIAFQSYDIYSDHDYQLGREVSCNAYDATENMSAQRLKYLTDRMVHVAEKRGGYLPTPKAQGDRLTQDNLYENDYNLISKSGQEIGYDFLVSNVNPEYYHVCKYDSKNLDYPAAFLLPPETTARLHLLATKNGTVSNDWNCSSYHAVDTEHTMERLFSLSEL